MLVKKSHTVTHTQTQYLRAVVRLVVRHVRVMDIKQVIANHLLPHSTGPLCHVQLELV